MLTMRSMSAPTPAVHLIYARARNGVIGRDNQIPWHLPEDMAHFRQTTQGCPVIMGRKTWDSLPPRFRPLPGRSNIVITRQPGWQAEGALVAHSLPLALALCRQAPVAWVMGGAEIYALALPLAAQVNVTEIDLDVQGDAFAPPLDNTWQAVAREAHTSANGTPFAFVTYRRAG